MKKFIVSILLLLSIILFSNNAVTFAKEKTLNLNVDAYSDDFPDAKLDKKLYDVSDLTFYYKNNILMTKEKTAKSIKILSIIKNDPALLKDFKDNFEKGGELIAIGEVTAFVNEEYHDKKVASSQLMNTVEVAAFTSKSTSATNSARTLTLKLTVWDYSSSTRARYIVASFADWKSHSIAGSSTNYPAIGVDYLGIYWGGGFDFIGNGISVTPSIPGSTLYSGLSDVQANTAVVYQFNELMSGGSIYNYAKTVTVGTELVNPFVGNGKTTSISTKYIHTYSSLQGSISISLAPPSFSLSGFSNQWNIAVVISGIPY